MKTILFLILAASPIMADDVVTVTLDSVNGATADGFYASPYTATIDGLTYEVWCDDILDTVSIGQSWQATVGDTGKFAAADYPILFALANEDTPTNQVDTQLAMWTLTDLGLTGATPESNALLAYAEANPYTGSAFDVVTPVAGGPGQEFIVDAIPEAPEPGTWWMSAAIGCALVGLRRRRA